MASTPDFSDVPSSSFYISPPRISRIPDDTLFYAVYPDPSPALSDDLSSLNHRLNSIAASLAAGYIWQHEPFHLFLPSTDPSSRCLLCSSPAGVHHLHGKLRYGDNVEDEWLAVFILYELSRSFASLSIRAWDSDGEFLLIEAAYALPRWLEPHSSRNRVFIRQGHLRIVPKSLFPSNPSLQEALQAVRDLSATTAAAEIQKLIQNRLAGYPERALALVHNARALLPLPVAHVLKHEPSLISLAVSGFYDRDIDSMKHAARMERFLEEKDMVRVCVPMSRAMYGQLVQQRFQAPRCYPMPGKEDGPTTFREAELGMKIACGFEMMYQDRRQADAEGKGTSLVVFKQSLESYGCLQGLLPGSKEYQRIIDSALQHNKNTSLFSRTRETMNAPVQRIDEILAMPYSVNDFKGADLPTGNDDSWMFNGEEDLNSVILERQKELETYEYERRHQKARKQPKLKDKDAGSETSGFKLGDISDTMKAFVQKISSFEGAEVPANRNPQAVELDVDSFTKEMEQLVGPSWCEADYDNIHGDEYTSSTDMDFDESEDERDELNDDIDAEDSFMQSYADILNKELNGTTIERSFLPAHQPAKTSDEGTSHTPKDRDPDFTPVDVDVNLVQSLLDSFSSQQGLPGPASNLLGLLGLKVPHMDSK